MRRSLVIAMVLTGPLLAGAAGAEPSSRPPLKRVGEIGKAINACWREAAPPPEAAGSEITVRFSLKRDGALLGVPRITYSQLQGDAGAQKAFVGAALAALESCLPLPLSPELGGAVAGRPFTVRLAHRLPPPQRV